MPHGPRPSLLDPDPDHAREADLLAACRAGDRAALTRLLDGYRPRLERICRQMSTPDAYEDILQDTYLTIVRAIASFRGESAFLTWAYAVCRSCSARWYARKRRDPPFSAALADELPASAARPALVEAGQLVRLALVALAPLDRDILVMRDAEGMSSAEVARETGLTVGAVKTRLHRARVAARARITELDAPARAA